MLDVVIVGGGLSGLSTAVQLARAGRSVRVLEARSRLGGRISSAATARGARVELGPAWIWPGQPRVAALAQASGGAMVPQYTGDLVLWSQGSGPPRRVPFDVHMGAQRATDGFARWIDALQAELPDDGVWLGARVTEIRQVVDGVEVEVARGEARSSVRAKGAVLAMPPRLIAALSFTPALSDAVQAFLPTVATWMAGEAKVVAVYDRPFWRDEGLSGDGLGTPGPLQQIYDASAPGMGALGGFVGWDRPRRLAAGEDGLKRAAVEQLTALFGPAAAAPLEVHAHDWTADPETATEADVARPEGHPDYAVPFDLGLWGGRLVLSGTELAPCFGGYLEGALAASEVAVARMLEAID